MKYIIIIILFLGLVLLTGCGIFNLSGFVMPDDLEFLAVIESVNTPKKICNYMEGNFEWELHVLNYSPYQMWLANTRTKAGDCNDMSCWAIFAANWHGYETYQIWVFFKGAIVSHLLGVFVENGKYTYSNNQYYHPIYVDNFSDIVEHYFNGIEKELSHYKVYNYNNDIIEEGRR